MSCNNKKNSGDIPKLISYLDLTKKLIDFTSIACQPTRFILVYQMKILSVALLCLKNSNFQEWLELEDRGWWFRKRKAY